MQQKFGGLLKSDGFSMCDEGIEEARGQIFQRFLVSGVVCGEGGMRELMNGPDCFLESPPKIIVLGRLAHHLQTLKDVDDVVDASALNFELESDLVQFQQDFPSLFKVLDEFAAQFLEALLLAVIGQDLALDHLPLEVGLPRLLAPLLYHKHRPPLR